MREFRDWLDEAQGDLKRHIVMMKKDIFPEDFNDYLGNKLHKRLNDKNFEYRNGN
jgi:hypothetical protein